jgi:hypothetical protein
MSKPNIRSFRFSDETAKIIMDFNGSSMNEKFENLVFFCKRQLPQRQQALALLEKDIEKKRQEYWQLIEELREVSSLMQTLKDLKRIGDMAVKKAELVCKTLPGQEKL